MKMQLTLLSNAMRRMFKTVEYYREDRILPIFKSAMSVFAALGISIALNNPVFADPTKAPLLQKADLVYQGAFRVPTGMFDYGGTALGFNPVNSSLFLANHAWYQDSGEISIPAIINSSNIDNLAIATLLQTPKDATEGRRGSIDPGEANGTSVGGHLVYNNRLIVSASSDYDSEGNQQYSHFNRPMNLSNTGQVVGPYAVGNNVHYTGGFMTYVPPEWQSLLGGPALTGRCCGSIISVQSAGPTVTVFDPSVTTQIGVTLLAYPGGSNPLKPLSQQSNVYNITSGVSGVVFPVGTRSVLFFGNHGTGPYCYGTGGPGGECYDPGDYDKSTHAYPYVYQVWAYDANDLLAVKNGAKQQYEPQPYAIWNFNLPFEEDNRHILGGAAYDSKTNLIYISQPRSGDGPVIHVFKVQGGTTSTSLNSPTDLRIN